MAGELCRAGLEEAERRRVGVATGVDRELKVVVGVVGVGVGGEAASGPVLETLIDGQNDELAGAGEPPRVEQARDLGERAGVVGAIVGQNLLDAIG